MVTADARDGLPATSVHVAFDELGALRTSPRFPDEKLSTMRTRRAPGEERFREMGADEAGAARHDRQGGAHAGRPKRARAFARGVVHRLERTRWTLAISAAA